MVHGGVISEPRHVGDFGNIMAEENGVAKINFEVTNFPDMAGPISIIDKTLVIHEKEDDLGYYIIFHIVVGTRFFKHKF